MSDQTTARRSMLTGIGAALATVAIGSRSAAAATTPARASKGPRHEQDEWMWNMPGRHRTFIDCSTTNGAGEGIHYANSLYVSNREGYNLPERDVAVIVGLRHFATAFAYNDAMWTKYGKPISELVNLTDPKTQGTPKRNLLNSSEYGRRMSNSGTTIASVVERGTHFAVCDMASRSFADQIAKMTKGNADDVYSELLANLIPNSHLVAAGVLAVTRSQELGFTTLTAM